MTSFSNTNFYAKFDPQSTPVKQIDDIKLGIGPWKIRIPSHRGALLTPTLKTKISPFFLSGENKQFDLEVQVERNPKIFLNSPVPKERIDSRETKTKVFFQGHYFWGELDKPNFKTGKITYFDEFSNLFNGIRILLAHQIIYRQSGFLVHASGAKLPAFTTVFPGYSRKGKSTAISTTPGTILSDEIIAFDLHSNRVWGTPFGGDYRPSPQSGDNLILGDLVQSPDFKIHPLSKSQMVKLLLKNTVYINFSPQINNNLLVMVDQITDLTRGFKIFFDKSGKFWDKIYGGLS